VYFTPVHGLEHRREGPHALSTPKAGPEMSRKNSLKSYREKRDFRKTPEPSDKSGKSSGKPIFVIQKHDSSSLHYDLRLEVDGMISNRFGKQPDLSGIFLKRWV
jgi:hypothetical protein